MSSLHYICSGLVGISLSENFPKTLSERHSVMVNKRDNAVYRGATGAIQNIWHSWWGRGLGFVDIVEATAFFFVDIGLGAFLATML
jgi:hypothetical protein